MADEVADTATAEPPVVDTGPAEVADIQTRAAQRMARGAVRGTAQQLPDTAFPHLSSDPNEAADEYERLRPGKTFIDPTGGRRVKPYTVRDDDEFSEVPEGAQFVDPKGELRTKPRSAPISTTSQYWFNLATNDKERKNALEGSYPGKVKKVGREWYIDDNGTLRKPKGLTETMQGFGAGVAQMALPLIFATGGEVLGGLAGGGVGAVPGAIAGGVLGQAFNDMIFASSGYMDRGVGGEAGELALAGASAAGGSVAGRAVAGALPALRSGQKMVPAMIANVFGVDPEGLALATEIKRKGGDAMLIPPSVFVKESPHAINLTEVLDPAFRQWDPLGTSRKKYYVEQVTEVLNKLDIPVPPRLLNLQAKIDAREAGDKILQRTTQEMIEADAKVKVEFDAKRESLRNGTALESEKTRLKSLEQDARQKATDAINAGYDDIARDADAAMKVAGAGSNSGDLWWTVAEKFKAIRQAIGADAKKFYNNAYQVAGDHSYNISQIAEVADEVLSRAPEDFQKSFPALIDRLRRLAGVVEEHTDKAGNKILKITKEPELDMPLAELHQLRTILRDSADWYTPNSDFKNGSLKFLADTIDKTIQDVEAGTPAETAVRMLNATDEWYGNEIKVFNSRNIKTVMDGLRNGEPADPSVLYNAIVKEGHTDLTKKIMDMIGPNLASGVRAADVQEMLKASEGITPGTIEGQRFVREVMARQRTGMLETVHGPEMAAKLRKQAEYVAALEGNIPVPVRPNDTVLDIISRVHGAAEMAQRAASKDPLVVFERETKKLAEQERKALAAAQQSRTQDPLGKLIYSRTIGAQQAAETILRSEDLLLASVAKFGEDSAEWKALQEVYVQRLFSGTEDITTKLQNVSDRVQALMFPGVSKEQVRILANEMDALLATRAAAAGTGKSIMATTRVEHPLPEIPLLGHSHIRNIVGSNFLGRSILTKYYKFVTEALNSPRFMRMVERGVTGDEQSRAAIREQLKRWTQVGGAVGAAGGEERFQHPVQ